MDFGVAFTGQKLLRYIRRKICDKWIDVTSGKRNDYHNHNIDHCREHQANINNSIALPP